MEVPTGRKVPEPERAIGRARYNWRPSGVTTTVLTLSLCPAKVRTVWPEASSQSLSVPS